MQHNPQPAGAVEIVRHAIEQLKDREQRLARFEGELADTRRMITVLEKALGPRKQLARVERTEGGHQLSTKHATIPISAKTAAIVSAPSEPEAKRNPRAAFLNKIIGLLTDNPGLTGSQLAQGLGRGEDDYLSQTLNKAVERGALTLNGRGEYRVG